ncbi:MAG: PLP-dependent transferase [Verrucomicrobia bacterium]|nr:MAG: PLP-dependent transferase [Verrucomicrobiota bacterium]
MNVFQPIPLGTRIPPRLHAVSCSLPTMRDVIGYEEKDEETVAHMCSGYPRFVIHPLLLSIERAWRERFPIGDDALWLLSSEQMANQLAAHLEDVPSRTFEHDGVIGLAHPGDDEIRKRARAFLQHTGGLLSSRAAEDYAVRHGLIPAHAPEETWKGDALERVRSTLAPYLYPDAVENIRLGPSGMNAFWAAFNAVSELQRPRGRDTWLQVGWLYLDTGAILAKFTHARFIRIYDVHDRSAIETAFREHGDRLAGVVTEVTTNPLMQTVDLPWLAALAREHGACMVVDPSITSPRNVDVTPHADIIVNSLTKYAACEGDVILGAVAINPTARNSKQLIQRVSSFLEPVYPRDLARLAAEIGQYDAFIDTLNTNARQVIDYLRNRSRGVRRLFWSLQEDSRANFLRLARAPDRIGPVFSFEIDGPMPAFYDAVPLPKGPSFGMRNTLLCPFIYLAHYDLVTDEAGRRQLAAAGVSPDLLRISIGAEPAEAIIEAFEIGFRAAGL